MSCGIEFGAPRRAWALCLGASAGVLACVLGAPAAQADVTVSGGDTPVTTATASANGPDNIVQTGTLSVSAGPAITLNSDNSVTNSGTIQVQNQSGVTGILALGGHTGSITNSGPITLNESATTTTTDKAGNVIGPFATGSDRYGIRVQGPGTLTGDITSSGAITVQGNQSAAISVEAPLAGSILVSGAITASGTDSVGLRTTGPVSGAVSVTGAISASGPGAQAVSLGGDAGGGLVIGSTVYATGYHSIARSTTSSVLADQNLNDAAQGGSAVSVAGSLGQGLLIAAPPAALSSTVSDVNGDGLADSTETTGTVTAYGSAPAIVVGAVGRDVQLDNVASGAPYGVVIEGAVAGQGLRDGVAANGLQLGVAGGGAVAVPGGVNVIGSLTATAYSADATALHLLSGASVARLNNSNRLAAVMTGETQNTARAVVVEAGAALPVILNSGTISAIVVGSSGSVAAITDRAGSLTHLENTGTISATIIPAAGSTLPVTGTAVAIDDSANTSGLAMVSYQAPGSTTAPAITGSILMGSGADSLDVQAGTVTGDLAFGAGANSLRIDGGAQVAGAVTAQGGTLALSIGSGALQINNAVRLDLTSLNLGASSKLTLTIDPAAGAGTELDVAGAASIAEGAKIGLRFASILNGQATYTLIHASQLASAGAGASLLGATPYLYDATLATDPAAGDVSVTVARKTAAQLQLPGSIAAAYEPVIAAVSGDPALSAGLLAPTDRASFTTAYNQLLPEHSGGVFQLVRAGVDGFGRTLDDRQGPDGRGGWLSEVNFGVSAPDRDTLPGYKGWGVGLIGGMEAPATRAGVFGVTLGGFSGELRPHDSDPNSEVIANLVEAGGYWRATVGRFALNARVAADYLKATDRRVVSFSNAGETVFSGTASGHWSGWAVSSQVRASYEARWDSLYLRPQLGLDYLRLSEGAYTEGGGGAVDLAVGGRDTAELAGFAGVAVGAIFGEAGASWGPELTLGYRDVVSGAEGITTARFLSGGGVFAVGPNPVSGQGAVARVALKSESSWGAVALEGEADVRDGLTAYDARLAAHFLF